MIDLIRLDPWVKIKPYNVYPFEKNNTDLGNIKEVYESEARVRWKKFRDGEIISVSNIIIHFYLFADCILFDNQLSKKEDFKIPLSEISRILGNYKENPILVSLIFRHELFKGHPFYDPKEYKNNIRETCEQSWTDLNQGLFREFDQFSLRCDFVYYQEEDQENSFYKETDIPKYYIQLRILD